jgi:hypothetical protein
VSGSDRSFTGECETNSDCLIQGTSRSMKCSTYATLFFHQGVGSRVGSTLAATCFGSKPKQADNPSLPGTGTTRSGVTSRSKRTSHPQLTLAICCVSMLITGMDVTVVNVALPAIQKDFHAQLAGPMDPGRLHGSRSEFLILAGSISDRFGRRGVFQIGLGVFTLGSVLCSLAGTVEQLSWFRALQGCGATMLNPFARAHRSGRGFAGSQ